MSRMRYIYCVDCAKCIRTDDGSFCKHYQTTATQKNSESITVIYRSKEGKITAPFGDPDDPKIKAYAAKNGLVREEYRGARAVRKLEKEMDAQDIRKHERSQLGMERVFGGRREQRREDLRQIMREGQTTVTNKDGSTRVIKVTQYGRDLARAALERSVSQYTKSYDPQNHRD